MNYFTKTIYFSAYFLIYWWSAEFVVILDIVRAIRIIGAIYIFGWQSTMLMLTAFKTTMDPMTITLVYQFIFYLSFGVSLPSAV